MVRLLSVILLLVFSWKSEVFQTAAQLQSSGAYLGKGTCVETLGHSEPGDGGAAMYKISVGTPNGFDKLAITGSSYIAELIIKKKQVNAKSYGFKEDIIQLNSISLSTSGIVSSPSAVFNSSDVGKKIYIRDAFDMRPKYEAYPAYQGTVANFSALPASPANKDLYQVTDASDDPFRDTLTGIQYYFWYSAQSDWVWLDSQQAGLFEITSFISPTQVQIDYSRPLDNASNRSGYFGTNNRMAWDSLSQFVLEKNFKAYFPGTGSGYLVSTEIDNPYDQLLIDDDRLELSGDGPGRSKIYLTHMPDTGVINADILDPINNPASNTFFNLAGTDIDFKADNLSFIGVDDVGYKRNDSWPEWAFMTASVTGKMEFENCHWSGAAGIGYYLNSSPDKLDLILKDCQADGGDNGMEVLLNWYGDNEEDLLYMENCHFKNIGQEEAWSFNAKNRGVIYVRPWKSHKAVGCTFENILDRWQDYDGGGSDRIHTFKGSRQSFEDCVFLANGKNTLYAYYGSRTAPLTEFNRCKFKGINGGNIFIGIAARSTSKIHNCQFGPGVSIPIFTQSNNNVWTEETFIDVDRCIFHSGGIEIYPNSPPVAPVHINIRNSEFPLDTNYTDGQRIKIHPGGNKAKVLLENLVFKDTNTNSGSIIFFEGGASADIIARNCYFGYNDGANQVEIVKQLRGTSTVTFIDCEVPDTITPRFTIDPYSGESGAKLYGRNNRFSNYSINNNPGNPAQAFDCYQIGTHTGVTDVNGEISVTLNQSCDFDWADIQIIGNNDFHADVISIDSSALNIRIKDDTGANVSSTSVQFNYTINKK